MFTRKILAFMLAAGMLLSFNSAQAERCSTCDGCFPYAKGSWSLGAQAGGDYTYFATRGNDLAFNPRFPVGFAPDPRRHPNFHTQFKFPAIYGGYIGYMVRNSVELFAEGNFATSSPKIYSFIGVDGVSFTNKLERYKYFDFYVGVRFYPFVCGCAAPFIGFKVGGAHRNRVNNTQIAIGYAGLEIETDTTYYKAGTVVSGGGQIGVNFGITDCLAIVLKGEVVVSGNWESTFTNIPIPTAYGSTGPVVSFPATIGLRLSW